MRRTASIVLSAATATLAAALVVPVARAAPAPATSAVASTTTNGCLTSVPDPGTSTPVQICYSVFRPAGATAKRPVPMVMHSHGWGGSRVTEPGPVQYLLDAGFGVVSFDQRGFGESGGQAYIENPDVEGKDVQRLVDLVTRTRWVEKEAPGDPVLGAIGGSYGGGYQFVGAFTELRDRGRTRFDALVPEITWNSLTGSLFPAGVPRTEWAASLTAAAVPSNALPPVVLQGFAQAAATGEVPQSLYDFLGKNGPAWHVKQGRRLDVPVMFGQGETDNLFPLREGFLNYDTALTPRARKQSIFVGYNGGHTLPSVLPLGTSNVTSDPCSPKLGSPDLARLGLRFLQRNLQGERTGLRGFGRYHLATQAGDRCVSVSSVKPDRAVPAADVSTVTAAGLPLATEIARGPLTVAGAPTLDTTLTSVGVDNRVFVSLSVGTSPLDARIVQNNMLPLVQKGIVVDRRRTGVELPAVAVDVPAGQKLFLTVSPVSDMAAGFGSRVVGAMTLRDTTVRLPVVG